MRRILKGDRDSLNGVVFHGEGFEMEYRESCVVSKQMGEIELDYEDYKYTLTLKTTDKCWFYDLKREEIESDIQEEVEEVTGMLLDRREINVHNFYTSEFESVIHLESEEEECLGFIKEGMIVMPTAEVDANNMKCVAVPTREPLVGYTATTSPIDGFLCYLGMKPDMLRIDNEYLTIWESKTSKTNLKVKEMYLIAKREENGVNELYIKPDNDKIILIREYDIKGNKVFTQDIVEDIPFDVTIVRERYVSKKTTKGITDKMAEPFSWLKY